ncbi:unnamed protein product [Rhizoctonia solani]|uniref:Velvet domain-containing protein n=1 Tax=Rhizoctonia solani TaxID=456999 RepID=A0A8H3D5B5_9AGAM|nr:unnamed protein product [Rhizoctonia solani]CAE6528086.1 unnamed protein product [Rhizoctonia solani]
MNAPVAQMESWGRREGDLHYSLEVVQHPLRARMCGFGDKDRRPLAPAAVAKMLVRRQDDTVVDADDIDIAFFLVTVDLWSETGTEEMNLVLHPSAGGHATSLYPNRRMKRPPTTAYSVPPPGHYDPQSSAPAPAPPGYPPRQDGPYPPRGSEESAGYPQRPDAAYSAPRPEGAGYAGRPDDSHTQAQYAGGYEDPRGSWPPHYPPPPGPSGGGTAPPGPAGEHPHQTLPPIGSIMASPSPNPQHAPHPHSHPHPHQRPYPPPPPSQWSYGSHNPGYIDPALQQPHMQPPHGQPPPAPTAGPAYPEEGVYPGNPPGPSYYMQTPAALHGASAQHEASSSTGNGQYTRTLVGPLSANASRLVDASNQPGIFFLFQDLSFTRAKYGIHLGLGTFRLRMRLMNVGAHPAPNAHATHVTTTSTPILAQTFTDPFTVYSAKRFPGVPETTPLSVAFGTQGQKLPLRNRNPGTSGKKGGRKNRGHGSDSEGDSEGGDSDESPGTG